MKRRRIALLLSLLMVGTEILGASLPVMAADTSAEAYVAASADEQEEEVSESSDESVTDETFADEVVMDESGEISDEFTKASREQNIPAVASEDWDDDDDDFADDDAFEDDQSSEDSQSYEDGQNPDDDRFILSVWPYDELISGRTLLVGEEMTLDSYEFMAYDNDMDWYYDIDVTEIEITSGEAVSCARVDNDWTDGWILTGNQTGKSTVTITYQIYGEDITRKYSFDLFVVSEKYQIELSDATLKSLANLLPGDTIDLEARIWKCQSGDGDSYEEVAFDEENMRIDWATDDDILSLETTSSNSGHVSATVGEPVYDYFPIYGDISAKLMVKNENGEYEERDTTDASFTVQNEYYILDIKNLEEISTLRAGASAQVDLEVKKFDLENRDGIVVDGDVEYYYYSNQSYGVFQDEKGNKIEGMADGPVTFKRCTNAGDSEKADIYIYAYVYSEEDCEYVFAPIILQEQSGYFSFEGNSSDHGVIFVDTTQDIFVNTKNIPEGSSVDFRLGYYKDNEYDEVVDPYGPDGDFVELPADSRVYTVKNTDEGYCLTFDGTAYKTLLGPDHYYAYLYATVTKDGKVQEDAYFEIFASDEEYVCFDGWENEKITVADYITIEKYSDLYFHTKEFPDVCKAVRITDIQIENFNEDAGTDAFILDNYRDYSWDVIANGPGYAVLTVSYEFDSSEDSVEEEYPAGTFTVYMESAFGNGQSPEDGQSPENGQTPEDGELELLYWYDSLESGSDLLVGEKMTLESDGFIAVNTFDDERYDVIPMSVDVTSGESVSCTSEKDASGSDVWKLTGEQVGRSTVTVTYRLRRQYRIRKYSFDVTVVPEKYEIEVTDWKTLRHLLPGDELDVSATIMSCKMAGADYEAVAFDKETMRVEWTTDQDDLTLETDPSDSSHVYIKVSDSVDYDETGYLIMNLMVKDETGEYVKCASEEELFKIWGEDGYYYDIEVVNQEEISSLRPGTSAPVNLELKKFSVEDRKGTAVTENVQFRYHSYPAMGTFYDENGKEIYGFVTGPVTVRNNLIQENYYYDLPSVTAYICDGDRREEVASINFSWYAEDRYLTFESLDPFSSGNTVEVGKTKDIFLNTEKLPEGYSVAWKLGYYQYDLYDEGDVWIWPDGAEEHFIEFPADGSVYSVKEAEGGYWITIDGTEYKKLLGTDMDRAYLYAIAMKDGEVQEIEYRKITVSEDYQSPEDGQPSLGDVTEVVLDKNSLELKVGQTAGLSATVQPETASDKTITWSSSDDKVASVSESGEVTAVANGTATITATAHNGLNASCTVTVTTDVSSVKLDRAKLPLKVDQKVSLKATVLPETASNKTIIWSSSDDKVASVSESGEVTALANGTATITATAHNGLNASCTVTVTTDVTGLTLNRTSLPLKVKKSATLTATVLPETASNKTVTWTTSNPKVATVKNGVVTAVANGSATITATSSNSKIKATCTVRVTTDVTSVKLNRTSLSLKVKGTSTLTATVAPSTASNKTLTWSSSNTKVATVNSAGKVTAVANGTAKITAQSINGVAASCTVRVTTDVTGVTLSKKASYLVIGKSLTLTGTVAPATASNKTLTWKTSNSKIATVNSAGKVVAKASGTATITVTTVNGKTATCRIVVPQMKLKTTSLTVLEGKSSNITISSKYPTNDTVKSYKSSNTAVAKVNSSGKVTGVAAGTATITVTMKTGATATCKVTVQPVTKSLSLSRTTLTLQTKKSATLKATRNPSGAKETITWKSSNTSVATVNSSGKVTAVKAGTATITAQTSNGKKATCKVTVKNPSVTLTKTSGSIKAGKTVTIAIKSQFPSNDTVKSYKSSNTGVATVNSKGVVKGVKAGTATITVTMASGAKATFKVTVTK